MPAEIKRTGMLLIISGPSGTGKGTLVKKLTDLDPSFRFSCSVTTRGPREGEIEGVHYYFVTEERYDELVAQNAFLEHATVHGHRYGTLKSEVSRIFGEGHSVVLEIDVQGGLNVRKVWPGAVLVFIEPPSAEELERRLRGRGTEDEASIELRLSNAAAEMAVAPSYDERIVNDDLDRAVGELADLIDSYETKERSL